MTLSNCSFLNITLDAKVEGGKDGSSEPIRRLFRYGGGLNLASSSGNSEKRPDSRCNLEIVLTGYVDRLGVRYKKESKMISSCEI